ncbi:MAG TPA: VWA domain-containing protein [Candidatus Angelobacter sp.]|nr:VWA domain-containing protein [Candidatus Angelobacter sp.]
MRRVVQVSLVALAFALVNLCLSPLAFAQNGDGANSSDDQKNVFKKNVDLVSLYFTVRDDKKHLASQLDEKEFHVFEDGREQPIKFFAHHTDVKLNVGVLLDTGTNMAWILNEEATASGAFLKHVVRPTDLGFILSYHSRVETIQVPTSDTELLQEKVDQIRSWGTNTLPPDAAPAPPRPFPGNIPPIGPTGQPYNQRREAHLYDAIRVSTLRYLEHEVGRKAVVIVAMSGDSKSESVLEDAMEVLLQNDVIAYVLQIYDPPRERSRFDRCDVIHTYERDEHGEEVLKKLAEATGGRMLEVRGMDKLNAALDEISEELHHQYSLGYTPENQNWDGKFRKVQITAQPRGYKVFARKGYYGYPKTQAMN